MNQTEYRQHITVKNETLNVITMWSIAIYEFGEHYYLMLASFLKQMDMEYHNFARGFQVDPIIIR